MHKYDLCCIGHITLDKVITTKNTVYMPGGTSFYCSHAINQFNDIDYTLVASLAESELPVIEKLRSNGIHVDVVPSKNSLYFENSYSENQDERTQRVLAKGDPFRLEQLKDINAKIYLLGALLADDFPLEIIEHLSKKGMIAVDSQGYLREVREKKVYAVDWADKEKALKYVHTLKVNEIELKALTGTSDVIAGGQQLFDLGVKEILITLGSFGSVIYDGHTYYKIPAYEAREIVDATGCGDTYIIGYLYQRLKGADIADAGKFAAAMATLKIEGIGPFCKTKEDVLRVMKSSKKQLPII